MDNQDNQGSLLPGSVSKEICLHHAGDPDPWVGASLEEGMATHSGFLLGP